MSHGAAHSPVPPPEPAPALLGCCCLARRDAGLRGGGQRSGGRSLCPWRGIPHRAPPRGGPTGEARAVFWPRFSLTFYRPFAGNGVGGETCGVQGAGVVSAWLRGCLGCA